MTPEDRDYLIRTVIGEAARQPRVGQEAVAHVVLNRAKAGKFGGDTIRDVVLAPNQFEPWSVRANELKAIRPDDPVYQKTAALVDSLGEDPTGGATHFLNEDIVRQRRGGALPRWAEEMAPTARRIGEHTFYGGESVAQADPGTMNDGGPTLEQVRAEIARRKASGAPEEGGPTLEQVRAEIARRKAAASPAPAAPAGEQPERAGAFPRASRVMANDLNAGFQGVSPIKMMKAEPIGRAVTLDLPLTTEGGKEVREVIKTADGKTIIPGEDGRKYVTMTDPDTGDVLVYEKTPEVEESIWNSFGRLLGFGVLGGPGAAVKAPAMTARQEGMQAAKDLGVTPSLSAGGPVTSRIASAGEQFFPTAGPITRDTARFSDELAGSAGRIADKAGPGSGPRDAGGALVRGGKEFVAATGKRSEQLYDAVERYIPGGTRVEPRNALTEMQRVSATFADKPEIAKLVGADKFDGLIADMTGGVNYGQLKAMRSAIGESIGKISGPMANQREGALKSLYAALTKDMEAAALAAGPKAKEAWERANAFYKARADRIENALDVIYKGEKTEVAPEKAFANVMALTGASGSRANLSKLQKIKGSLSNDEWGEVAGTVIRDLGKAPPGQQGAAGDAFSGAVFLSNWNRMDPTARTVLFTGKGLDGAVKTELDSLVKVLDMQKQAGKTKGFSNTGGIAMTGGMGYLAYTDPGSAIAMGVAAHLGARAITSRPVLRALHVAAKGGGVGRLAKIAAGNDAVAGEVRKALQLSGAGSSGPARQPASSPQGAMQPVTP